MVMYPRSQGSLFDEILQFFEFIKTILQYLQYPFLKEQELDELSNKKLDKAGTRIHYVNLEIILLAYIWN